MHLPFKYCVWFGSDIRESRSGGNHQIYYYHFYCCANESNFICVVRQFLANVELIINACCAHKKINIKSSGCTNINNRTALRQFNNTIRWNDEWRHQLNTRTNAMSCAERIQRRQFSFFTRKQLTQIQYFPPELIVCLITLIEIRRGDAVSRAGNDVTFFRNK